MLSGNGGLATLQTTNAGPAEGVEKINPLDGPGWSEAIQSCPEASISETKEWTATLHDTYGFKPVYLAIRRAGRISATLPLMEVCSLFTGCRGISLPFTDDCSLSGDADDLRSLIGAAFAEGRRRRWKYLEFRSRQEIGSVLGNPCPSLQYYSHRLKLDSEDKLFQRLDPSVRRAVRKAETAGIKVACSNSLDSVREFYRLHCMTRQKHGAPPQPFRFFLNIHRHLLSQNLGMICSATLHGETIASALFLTRGEKALYRFGASNQAFQAFRANNLVMWEAIKRLAVEGRRVLDFGRTSLDNAGLRRYKLSYGTSEQRLSYYKFDFRKDAFVSDRDITGGGHARLFRALPIPIARFFGALLYKHIA